MMTCRRRISLGGLMLLARVLRVAGVGAPVVVLLVVLARRLLVMMRRIATFVMRWCRSGGASWRSVGGVERLLVRLAVSTVGWVMRVVAGGG